MINQSVQNHRNEKFIVRMPFGLRDQVEAYASITYTSMNTVFIRAVEQYLDKQKRMDLLLDALAFAASYTNVEVRHAGV
ncbi:Arc family DNA-binding protein [Pseudomonas sp. RIT-To-2]|uniref:Arc family DNA-binding protein n=1 Tax=Pseudomonas sp. RIT-To-2 TaxID=3462541 RepID=UPI002413A06D